MATWEPLQAIATIDCSSQFQRTVLRPFLQQITLFICLSAFLGCGRAKGSSPSWCDENFPKHEKYMCEFHSSTRSWVDTGRSLPKFSAPTQSRWLCNATLGGFLYLRFTYALQSPFWHVNAPRFSSHAENIMPPGDNYWIKRLKHLKNRESTRHSVVWRPTDNILPH